MQTHTGDETMPKVEIYSKFYCPYCKRAKQLLNEKGVKFEEIEVSRNQDLFAEMVRRSKHHTVPQIFIDGHHIGGSDDLNTAQQSGELDRLLMKKVA
jgi:glutaredoxin 3